MNILEDLGLRLRSNFKDQEEKRNLLPKLPLEDQEYRLKYKHQMRLSNQLFIAQEYKPKLGLIEAMLKKLLEDQELTPKLNAKESKEKQSFEDQEFRPPKGSILSRI